MKAGRELDAKVAGELFGWKKDHWDWEFSLPHYSTSIAAAMLVVEKLIEMGYYVDIGVDEHGA